MKKTILSFLFAIGCITGKAQSCINVVSSQFTNPSNDGITWNLVINYTANGTKSLKTYVFVGTDTAINACFQTSVGNNVGTITYDSIIAPGGLATLRAKFVRGTGTCGNGTSCGGDQDLVHNVLDIKITDLVARNIRNTTEVTFTILSIESTSSVYLNFYMPDGSVKKRRITLPGAKSGQRWTVIYNNITDTYKPFKL